MGSDGKILTMLLSFDVVSTQFVGGGCTCLSRAHSHVHVMHALHTNKRCPRHFAPIQLPLLLIFYTDINGCSSDPCSSIANTTGSAGCQDIAAPSTGFTCACMPGFEWNGQQCAGKQCLLAAELSTCFVLLTVASAELAASCPSG